MDKQRTLALVRRGVTAALTATMVVGSMPTGAIAETLNGKGSAVTAGLGDVPAAQQATTQLTAEQAAQLLADSGTSQLPDPTAMPEIADGTYTVNVETRDAANPSNLSMSANTVSREAKLVAKDGQITLTIDFKAWDNQVFGDVYLGGLYYYNKAGVKTPGKVIDTQKNADGTPVKDKFSDMLSTIGVSEYPDHVEIPLSDTTVVNNYFKLGVFVPVMESLTAGQGSKDALLNVDWSSLKSDAPAAADTTALTKAIAEAQKVEQGNKTDEAYKTLQDAIAAAQKVVDSKPTDQNAVDAAVDTLNKAVETFKASEDAKPEVSLEAGKTYSVPVAFKRADDPSADSMSGGFFQPKATVVANEGGTYTVTLTTKLEAAQKGWLSDFKVGDKVAETKQVDDNNVSFTFTTDDISQAIGASVKVTPMGSSPSLLVVLDASKAEEVKPSTDPYEAGYKLYYKAADATSQFVGRSFESKVKVVPQADGTYVVELTAKTLGTSGQLGDVTLAGQAVKYTDHEDGSRTYELPVKDVKGTVNFTFGYTAGKYNANHPFQLVLDNGEYTGIAGFVDEQVSVAEAALKAGENKTDEAKEALQKAIDDAKAATDDATRSTALNSLVNAINTFKASADKPQGALQDGALYEVPVSIVNDEIEKPNIVELSMEKLFSKGQKALVTYKDGKYTVQITTLYTGSNGVSDVEYGADNAVATKVSSTADTITWNLTVDTLDDLHIVGNWVSSGSSKKYARAKGTIGLDADNAVKVSATDEQKGALTDAIAEAKKVEQGKKSVTAFQKLTDAIASAEKVAANSFATADQTTGATDSVKKAVEDFNASADVTTNPELKDGSYNVSLNIAVPHPNAVSSSYEHPEWDGAREFISKAISTKAKVVVKDGKYTLSLNLDTVSSYDPTAGSMWPAIGKVQYYTGYDITNGVATGTLADATINSYITWSGSDEHVSNKYGTDYPANISIPLDSETLTRDDATLPLEVSIPHFKANGYGTGTEQVMAQIDWSTAINTDELGNLIDSAKKVEQGTKTLSAFEDLQDAITAAEKVLNGGSKVQSDYDNATAALQKAIDTFNNSAEASKLDKDTLAPGTYEVQLEMFGYTAPDIHSMSDGSVEHTAQVVVDDEGNYSLVITTKGQYMAQYGGTFYMGAFNMYDDDGTTVIPGTVLDTVKNEDGSEYTDQFNTGSNPVQKGAYPAKVSLPLSKKAVDAEAGRVKVQVFVPVMESLMGNGHQDAYARIDWTTLTAKDVKPTEVDTTALKAAIAEAQKVEQGNKTDEAFQALQAAIAEAQKVASAAKDQKTVDAAVDTLNKAVETFKNSADKPADLEAGKVYTAKAQLFKQDGTTEFRTVLLDLDKVEVRKNADGTYEADISTVPGYISESYNFKLSDGFDGTEPTIVWQSGNDYTFRVTGDSLDNLQAHLTYAGGMMGNTDEKLVIKLTDAKAETVDKSALADAIKNAPEQGSKTDEAFATLTAAKEAAQKVADQTDATTAEVKTALSTFQAAVDAFNKSEDKPSVDLEKGKTYYVPVTLKKADDPSADSMAGGFFQDKARVTKVTDDSYTVTLTTKLEAGQKGWLSDFKVGDQAAQSAAVEGDENNVTFTFTVSDISKPIVASCFVQPMNSSPSFYVVLDTTNLEDEANTDALYAEIQKAEAIKITDDAYKNKTLAAWYDLQDAISAASALRSVPPAASEQAKVDQAAKDLQAAVETFKAAPERTDNATFRPIVGKEYTADVRWIGKQAGLGSVAESMINKNISHEVTFTYNEDGTYTFKIRGTGADKNHAIQKITVGDKEFTPDYDADPNGVYTVTFDSVAGEQAFKVFIGGAMTGMFPNGVDMAMDVDVTGLEQAPAVPDPYESAYQIYYKGVDATDQYVTGDRASFNDKVRVVPQADGTAIVELTAKSLGKAGKLADVKVDGQAVKYTDHEDGSRTYELPVKDVKGTTDFTFGYTVSFGGREQTMEHPFQLVLAGGTYAGYTATKAFLDEQIASATKKLAASKKDDAANAAYKAAIDAAQAVSDKQGATPAEYGKAVQDLDAATKTFNDAPDKPAAPTVEAGKVYTATGTFYDETGTTESSAMKGFFKPEVEVRKTADGTYEVDVKTIDEGVATAYGLSVSSGFDSTESDVVYSEVKGDNTVATYRLTGDDLSNIKVHVGYDAGVFKGSHNLVLKVDAASVKEETVDKTALADAIAKVPSDKGSKTDEAFATLTAAKEAAQKVADQTDATTGDVAAAVAALNKAVADFNASEDAKPEVSLEEGKTYSVPVSYIKSDGSGDTSMTSGFMQPTATVTRKGDTYTVTLTTKLTASQKGWISQFKADGQDAVEEQVDESNVSFTFTTTDITKVVNASAYVQPMGYAPTFEVVLDASKAEEVKPAEADKTALNEAIASAQKVEQGTKTDEAFKALQDAIAAAQKVAGDEAASQDAVDAAVETLNKAVETFKSSEDKPTNPETVDTSKLQAAIASAQKVEQGKKSDDAFAALKAAIAEAQDALDAAKDQQSVDDAVTALNKAVETFKSSADVTPTPEPGDKVNVDKLNGAIEAAKKLEQGNKTDEAYKALQDAIAAAEAVAKDPKDQKSVDDALSALNAAVDTFGKAAEKEPTPEPNPTPGEDKVDTSKLEAAIADAKKLEQGNKTDEVWKAFQDAIAAAQKVVDSNPSDQYTVDNALSALRIANYKFQTGDEKQASNPNPTTTQKPATTPSTTTTPNKTTSTPTSTTGTKTATTSTKKLAQTSDPTSIAGMAAAAVAGLGALGAGIAARLRGRKNRK